MSCKIVFMGTPEFAVPSLQALIDNGYDVIACITQPDRKAGRGHKLTAPPVKQLAESKGIPVYQFEKISGAEGTALLKELAPDLMITAAFGHILSEEILAIPQYGCINVHASLLPKLRGAAPIQWAIITGEKQTGITTMYTVKALDAGDILEQDAMDIPEDMTAGELYEKLSKLGSVTLLRTLEMLNEGTLRRKPQDESKATYYPMFKKGFGEIDLTKDCSTVINLVRGTNPVPGAYMMYNGEKVKVETVKKHSSETGAECGKILTADAKSGLLVQAADGVLSLEQIKRQGAKSMSAKESLRGRPLEVGYIIKKTEEAEV